MLHFRNFKIFDMVLNLENLLPFKNVLLCFGLNVFRVKLGLIADENIDQKEWNKPL